MTVEERGSEVALQMLDDRMLDDLGYEFHVIKSIQKGLEELGRRNVSRRDLAKEDR